MSLRPTNRYLLVAITDTTPEDEAVLLLPAEYRSVQTAYETVTVKAVAPDCNGTWTVGDTLVVEGHMLRDIHVGVGAFTVILENHVVGVIDAE